MTDTPNNTTAGDAGEMPAHLQEAAKQREEKRKAEELSQLATKARRAHGIVANSTKVVLQHAITAGNALNEAKSKVGHGNWLTWLEENCPDISNRTAERYMKLAGGKEKLWKKLEDTDKFDMMSNLSINEALRLIDEPDGEQSASAEAQETETEVQGDAAANPTGAAGSSGKDKGGRKGKGRKDSPKQLQKQIENFETDWDGLNGSQKRHFVRSNQHELAELLEELEALEGMAEEEAEAQPSLS
jgi:hypothetical protein